MSYQTSTSYRQINGGSDANSRQLTMTANSSELSYIYIYIFDRKIVQCQNTRRTKKQQED